MTAANLTAELLANGPFVRAGAPFVAILIDGPDAGDFLQRLCSQDVLGLADGQDAPAAFLDGKGKVLATCLVCRRASSFWLECQAEQVERLLALLDRYHFAEKLTFARRDLGPCSERIEAGRHALAPDRAAVPGLGLRVTFERHGIRFHRRHGGLLAHEVAPDDGLAAPGVGVPLSLARAQALRMAAGLVHVGVETEPGTLVLEAALDDHCSTTKGCYTGQEIVARIHTYGHVNRRLCLLRLPAGPPIDAPQPLHEREDRLAVGRVMHAVPVPELSLRVGLGYLPKDFQAPGTELTLADGVLVSVEPWGP